MPGIIIDRGFDPFYVPFAWLSDLIANLAAKADL